MKRLKESGAVFALRGIENSFEWDAVREINAFKQDLFTYDTISLEISVGGHDEPIVLTEDDVGFGAFTDEMEKQLKVDQGWYERVMRPAFAKNLARIYLRVTEKEEQP